MIGCLKWSNSDDISAFWKVERFKARSAQNGCTKKSEHSQKRRCVLHFFSKQPHMCSPLWELKKKCWCPEKNTIWTMSLRLLLVQLLPELYVLYLIFFTLVRLYFNMLLKLQCHVICLYYWVLQSCCSFILDGDGMSAVTMWIAGDFEKVSGRKLLLSALKHVVSIPSQ